MRRKKENQLTNVVENASEADPQQEAILEAFKNVTSKSGSKFTKFAINKTSSGMTLYAGKSDEQAGRIFGELPNSKRKHKYRLIRVIGDQLAKLKSLININNYFK